MAPVVEEPEMVRTPLVLVPLGHVTGPVLMLDAPLIVVVTEVCDAGSVKPDAPEIVVDDVTVMVLPPDAAHRPMLTDPSVEDAKETVEATSVEPALKLMLFEAACVVPDIESWLLPENCAAITISRRVLLLMVTEDAANVQLAARVNVFEADCVDPETRMALLALS